MATLTSLALLPHVHPGRAVFSPDGQRFVLTDHEHLVIHDRDGAPLTRAALVSSNGLKPHVYGLAWSPDGAYIATAEGDATRLRSATDLSVVTETTTVRMGPVAFCARGERLAIGSVDNSLHVVTVPSLADLGSLELAWGSYDSFDIDHVVADPDGTFVAASDYGGWSEDEWGHTSDRGIPKVTILDADTPTKSTHDLTQTKPITALELDRWRRRLLVGNYGRVVVRALDTQIVAEWTAYPGATTDTTIRAIAVCERYVATLPDIEYDRVPLAIDLWDPTSYTRIASVPFLAGTPRMTLLGLRPWFVAPSPDGSRLVASVPEGARVFAVAL